MKISARADYAVRACIELVRAGRVGSTSEAIAEAQGIPQPFLQNILGDMRRAGYVESVNRRGGGYWLAAPADEVSVADVLRAMDGPLLTVHGVDARELRHPGSAESVAALWVAVRAGVATMLEPVSLRDVAAGRGLLAEPGRRSRPDDGPGTALTA